jgi:hypothetical protein
MPNHKSPETILRMVEQRHPADCCAAALAMLLGVSYEEALVATSHVEPGVLVAGMYLNQVQRAAKFLGVKLRRTRKYDLETDTGILNVMDDDEFDHVVVLRYGLFFNTDLTVWEPDVYLRTRKARPGTLLVEV